MASSQNDYEYNICVYTLLPEFRENDLHFKIDVKASVEFPQLFGNAPYL